MSDVIYLLFSFFQVLCFCFLGLQDCCFSFSFIAQEQKKRKNFVGTHFVDKIKDMSSELEINTMSMMKGNARQRKRKTNKIRNEMLTRKRSVVDNKE
jgi:hypothetical protein